MTTQTESLSQEEIISMARQAGFVGKIDVSTKELEAFAKLVASAALEQRSVSKNLEPVGVMVSMDVSKGDEPEYRIFGRIYEVQRDGEGEDEVTYLAIEDSRNFDATPPQRKSLTDEQIQTAARNGQHHHIDFRAGVQFAEAAHGIKE